MAGYDGLAEKQFVACFFCEKQTNATVVGTVIHEDLQHGPPARLTFMSCDVCNGPLLFAQEDYGEGFEADDLTRVWPSSNRQLNSAVPKELRDGHYEARKCFDAKAYTATVVMIGRTLEGVYTLNGIKARSLVDGLKKLREANLIDDRLHEWTSELRVLRNQGAHFTSDLVKREDARDALALSEALLDYMYVLTERFNEFKARRAGHSRKGDDGDKEE
ncbi:DUF4145 domain-containing protein [Pseudonocardia alni]|uniref:DUF4145 domain-containing protein n=1 Tax=Pseudonocardia alni TaxID=33907 RepID=UPI0036A003A3